MTTLEIRHDEAGRKFFAVVEGLEAHLLYAPAGDRTLDFQSTFVPPELRGRFIGSRLVRHALDYAREHGQRVIPSCWFVGTVVARYPEYREIVVPSEGPSPGAAR